MSTNKSIKIQKNKILTYSVNKAGFKTVYGTELVSENKNINIEMINLDNAGEPFQLGSRLFGISSFVDYFTPLGEYDVDSLKYISAKQTTGTSLTNLVVVKETWISQVETTLGIETPKGTSNNFIFTYDGANWNLTGATTQNNVDLEDYGISFTGTATNGDVITVTETQYNRFAFFVLDANYRSNQVWSTITNVTVMPKQYASNPQDCIESATYYNQYILNNTDFNDYPAFNYCKNLGNFILNENIKINCMVPNGAELQSIFDNRVALDNFDPVIQGGSTSYNLTNWNFNYDVVYSCLEYNPNYSWMLDKTGVWYSTDYYAPKDSNLGIVPIFEVPVM